MILWIICKRLKKNHWTAEVAGTDNYEVFLQLGAKASVKDYECDCPYDYGAICKHVVAVLYAVREAKTIDVSLDKTSQRNTKSKKPTFDALLKKIDVEEFRTFIKHYSKIQKNFKSEFELYFSDKDDSIDLKEKYAVLIRNLIKKYTSRGYVNYSDSNKLGRELNRYTKEAQTYLAKGNVRDAFVLASALITEASLVLQYADDSNGYISGVVYTAVEILEQLAVSKSSINFKEQLADFIKSELQKPDYYNFGGFGYDMTRVYAIICISIYKPDDFITFVDEKLKSIPKNNYKKRFFIEQKTAFLKEIGRNEEVQQLIQENISIPEIRIIEVNRLIDEKDYETAKKLLNGGIKIAEELSHWGTVRQWEEKLLEIAQAEKDIKFIRYFLHKFTFDRGVSLDYYKQWKATFTKQEWQEIIEGEIQEINKKIEDEAGNRRYGNNRYFINSNRLYYLVPIYIQENYIDRLWDLVQAQQDSDSLLRYIAYLKKDYAEELLKILLPYLEQEGERANGRSEYRSLVQTMNLIINEIPESKNRIVEVVQKLKDKFPRRPAMIEELNKIS